MNFAPSGLVWWCSRQRRRPWSRVLHGARSARVAFCMGRVLHGARSARVAFCMVAFCMGRVLRGSRSAWVAFCMGRVLAWSRSAWVAFCMVAFCMVAFCMGCPAQAVVSERRHVVVSGADERWVGADGGCLARLCSSGRARCGTHRRSRTGEGACAYADSAYAGCAYLLVPARAVGRWVVASWRIWRARAYDNCSREGDRNHISFYATGNGSGRSSEWKVRNGWRENYASGADA
jgi:hypothetical protein